MIFARLNLHINGGRFIQAARSVDTDPAGPYLPWQKIEVKGYDDGGPGNVYEANVEMNPIDDETVLGLFPVNLGEPGVPKKSILISHVVARLPRLQPLHRTALVGCAER
eukprot:3448366-Prymnesium_polylepis.1